MHETEADKTDESRHKTRQHTRQHTARKEEGKNGNNNDGQPFGWCLLFAVNRDRIIFDSIVWLLVAAAVIGQRFVTRNLSHCRARAHTHAHTRTPKSAVKPRRKSKEKKITHKNYSATKK